MRNSSCNLCEFGLDSSNRPKHICLMPGDLKQCDVMVVAEQPTAQDDATGQIFTGSILFGVYKYLTDSGLKVHCAYACKCARPSKDIKPKDKHIKTCASTYLTQELAVVQPKHVITLGAGAYYGSVGNKAAKDSYGGRTWIEKKGFHVYHTIHHLQAAFDQGSRDQLKADLERFVGWIQGGTDKLDFNPPVYVADTLKSLRKVQKLIRESGGIVYVDTETSGLNMYSPDQYVRSIQFCWDEDYGGVFVPLALEPDCYYSTESSDERWWRDLATDITKETIIIAAIAKADGVSNLVKDEALVRKLWEDIGLNRAKWEDSIRKVPAAPFWQDEPIEEAIKIIREILAEFKCSWHNGGPFDRPFLHSWGKFAFREPIIAPRVFMDTIQVAFLINENRRLGLKSLITTDLGLPTYNIPNKLTKDLSVLIPYATKDVVAGLMLQHKCQEILAEPDMAKTRKLYTKLIRPVDQLFTKVMIKGWPVSVDKCEELLSYVNESIDNIENRMEMFLAGEQVEGYNRADFGSTEKVAQIIFEELGYDPNPDRNVAKTPEGKWATSEDALIHLKHHGFIADLLRWRSQTKTRSTNVTTMLEMAQTRGRLTTAYKMYVASTGRTASGKEKEGGKAKSSDKNTAMNLQNLPYDRYGPNSMTVRDCVVAEPGWLIMEADESQVELRVAAHVSKDPVFIDAFQNDRDLHAYRARRIMKLTEEEWEALPKEVRKEKRQNAKAVNFGFLFKMKAPTFQKYALIQYGLELSMTECVEFERGFYNDHIGLITYYERQEREALRNGYVENPIGRRRHLPNIKQDQSSREQRGKYNEAVRQAINSPIQSFASDLKLMSMLEIDKNIDPGEAYIFGEIHDSILLCVREDCVDRVGKMVLDVMSHPALLDTFGVEVIVPIKAELKVGPSLGEAKEYVPR